jgi:hypothetical protein
MSPSSQGQPDEIYKAITRIFGGVIAVFGVIILVVTFANGGNFASAGFWLGLLFTALGLGRLYLAVKQ